MAADDTVACVGCLKQMSVDHGGLSCDKGHHLCLNDGCTKIFIDTQLADGVTAIPIKCSECKMEINDGIVARCMTDDQIEQYMVLMAMKRAIESDDATELLLCCPACHCRYYEYRVANADDILFMHCPNPTCKKMSCFTCKKILDADRVDQEEQEKRDDEQEKNDIDSIAYHFACGALRSYKEQFEQLLAYGRGGCHVVGKKDYGDCCHMTCPKCKTEWCYLCGESKERLGVGGGRQFYAHYQKPGIICPTQLEQLYDVVTNGAGKDENCIDRERVVDEYISRRRTLKLLKKFKLEIGDVVFQQLWAQFPMVRQSGFSMQEIDAVDLNASLATFGPSC